MRLKSVKLIDFRGYRATTVIPIDEAIPASKAAITAANRLLAKKNNT